MKTRSVAAFVSMLCATGLLAAPAGAATERVGGFAVTLPSDATLSTIQPNDLVRVSLVPSAKARAERRVATVSLSRVTRSGALLVISKRRLRSGGFSAALPREGLHRLRVTVGKRFTQREFEVAYDAPELPCAYDQGYEAELEASETELRPTDSLDITLSNTGPACFGVDFGVSWQVLKDGRWNDVSFGVVYPAVILNLLPGEKQVQRVTVPRNTPPGQYRAVKNFTDGEDITVEVTVTP